ncbi:MAG: sodium:solute symporter [Bacteroidota bacterium]
MTATYVAVVIAVYFSLLFIIAKVSSRKADASTFFLANRSAPWPLVAYGMIGVAISGITFISVPGQVGDTQFGYFQFVVGIVIGLLVVVLVLLPIFYRAKTITIYGFLRERFGPRSHKTGALSFMIAQTATAAFKLYLMAHVLQLLIFDELGLPFALTVLITLLLIWLYTYRGGIQTVILTDTLQTTFLLLAVIVSIWSISSQLDLSVGELYGAMQQRKVSQAFFWSWDNQQNFFRLMLTGVLLTVMTNGLDQSVMQKHLTCPDLRSSQKNVISLAVILIGVNMLFLFLGGALQVYSDVEGLVLPEQTDSIYPILAIEHLGLISGTAFLLGIAAAAYSSADSSLTGLTTSFCVDILNFGVEDDRPQLRTLVHLVFTMLIFLIILLFEAINNDSVLYAFIRTSGFIYGPLVGLFAFGIFSQRGVPDQGVPFVVVLAPLLSMLIDLTSESWLNYTFGYDILLVNSFIAVLGLYLLSFLKEKELDHTLTT